jgi:hypothetical protein
MDPYRDDQGKEVPKWEPVRLALGQTRQYAQKMNLAEMTSHNELASTRYCLAKPGSEYLVYLPRGGAVTVDLASVQGDIAVQWQNAATGKIVRGGTASGGARREFKAPFDGDALLYLIRHPDETKRP